MCSRPSKTCVFRDRPWCRLWYAIPCHNLTIFGAALKSFESTHVYRAMYTELCKHLRTNKLSSCLLQQQEQYQFCYTAALDYLESSDLVNQLRSFGTSQQLHPVVAPRSSLEDSPYPKGPYRELPTLGMDLGPLFPPSIPPHFPPPPPVPAC